MNRVLIIAALSVATQTGFASERDDSADWLHIAHNVQKMMHNASFRQAIATVLDSVENAAHVGSAQLASELSESEKEKVVRLIKLVRAIFRQYTKAVLAGNTDHCVYVDDETQAKIDQLGYKLAILIMPLIALFQDPQFAQSNEQLVNTLRIRFFDAINHTFDVAEHELVLQQGDN